MNVNYNRYDQQCRIDELHELFREPAIEAWTQLENGLDEESGADELGLHLEYFCKLVSEEFINQLKDGVSFLEFPELTIPLEDYCWKAVCSKIRPTLPDLIQTPICKQLRLKLSRLYEGCISIHEISARFGLVEKTVKALIMLAFVESGLTLAKTGEKFKVTRERTRQIIIETVGISIQASKKEVSSKQESRRATLTGSISSWILAHPGCYFHEIALALNTTEVNIREICPRTSRHLVIDKTNKRAWETYTRYSNRQIIDEIKKAYELRNPMMSMYSTKETQPLSGTFYDELRQARAVNGPSRVRIIQIFGTWRKACEEAEVPNVDAVRDLYLSKWTKEDLIKQLAEFLLSTKSRHVKGFDEWCRLDESRSSAGTIRNNLGHWTDSCQLALLHLRRQWTGD